MMCRQANTVLNYSKKNKINNVHMVKGGKTEWQGNDGSYGIHIPNELWSQDEWRPLHLQSLKDFTEGTQKKTQKKYDMHQSAPTGSSAYRAVMQMLRIHMDRSMDPAFTPQLSTVWCWDVGGVWLRKLRKDMMT